MMKKFFSLLAVLAALSTTTAAAQGMSFGLTGGVTNSSLKLDKDLLSSKNRYGWFIGPTFKFDLPLFFGVDASALYDQREVKINDESVKVKQISIPVNLRADINIVSALGVYAALGPQIAFNVGSSEFKWTDKSSYENTFQMKKSAFSLNFGAGVIVAKKLEVGAAYNVEMGNTSDMTWGTVTNPDTYKDDSKMRTWRIHATIYL